MFKKNVKHWVGMVAQDFNPRTLAAKAGSSLRTQGHSVPHNEVFLNTNTSG